MGGLFSRHRRDYGNELALVPASHSRAGTKRKKPDNIEQLNGTNNNANASIKLHPSEDNTPDGKLHKYIVRCSAIYWCTRKDIAKGLSKVERMPPYGGLHKIPKWDHFFITFPNKKCAEKGIECLAGHSFRGHKWEVSETLSQSTKRARIEQTMSGSGQQSTLKVPEGTCRSAADVTAKWRDLPYEEQISRKHLRLLNALRLVTKKVKKEVREFGQLNWLDDIVKEAGGRSIPACCRLEDMMKADSEGAKMYYRNKNELTIGMSPDTCGIKKHTFHKSEITIGYALGLVRDGQVFIAEVDDSCHTTSKTAIGVAQCLTPVIRALNLPTYDKRSHKGYWRQLTCREGFRTGQVIISVVVNPSLGDEWITEDEIYKQNDERCRRAIVNALIRHFGSERQFGVFWQPSDNMSAIASTIPAVHLHGIQSLEEEMCGLRFRIQPNAFFQVNTVVAERLYELIGEIAEVGKDTVVFDVCCGTGTIGLSLAKRAHSVVGIEMNESAIADARHNARLNDIRNATFICGKVEDKIHDAIKAIEGNRECVVILDPPRAGLPMNVVAAVRAMRAVKRVVYVACEPNNLWRNALGFCRPRSKAFQLDPFHPVKAYGVDLFPHTDHAEMVTLFERDTIDETERRFAGKDQMKV